MEQPTGQPTVLRGTLPRGALVRCPAIEVPDLPLADPAALDALVARLGDPAPVTGREVFPLGTLHPDGRVDLCKQGLGPVGVARVLPAVARSGHARHVLLGTNAFGGEGARAIADALADGHGLRTVYLGCNRIDATGAEALAASLTSDDTVEALWLKRNPVGDAGVAALAAMLRHNTRIRTLDLVNTGLTVAGLATLAAALGDRPRQLERLFLGGNGLGVESADVLAALARDCGVRELYLAANHLGDDGAATVAAAADSARTLSLGLGGNGIGLTGIRGIAEHLSGIERLDLGRPPSQRALGAHDNQFGDDGARTLAAALPGTPLRRLDLRHTGVRGRGAKALLAAVSDGTALEYVGFGPGVPRRVKRALVPHLKPAAQPHPDVRAIASVYR